MKDAKSNERMIVSHHSLRGIAALLVVFYHIKDISFDKAQTLDSITSMFKYGYMWVDFFFMLSGFILSYVYKARLSVNYRMGNGAISAFYGARFARIYPLHLLTLLCLLALEMSAYVFHSDKADVFISSKKTTSEFFANLGLIHSWGLVDSYTSWNVPSWSISTEWACYLIFPLVVLALRKASSSVFRSVTLGVSIIIYFSIFSRFVSIEDGVPLLRCWGGSFWGCLSFRYRRRLLIGHSRQ